MTHTLHLRAPGNWINDLNGFIFYKGNYHLFYQYFPYAPVWGTMHWGHAVSGDLIHWVHLGTALFPTRYEDQNGCFSGSALELDGKMCLYYTGIHYEETDPENIHACVGERFLSSQLMISSEDGIRFDNFSGKRVIIPVIEDEEAGDRKDTRDPKVWRDGGNFYMILGSTYRKETGRLLFYRSKDGENWEYAAQLRSRQFGKILECPDIFKAGDGYVMVCSPMYIDTSGGYKHHAVCMPVGFEPGSCTLTLPEQDGKEYHYVDYGMDLYAPQTAADQEGRRVLIGWLRMPKAVERPGEPPWNGMMSLPRVVEMERGHIYFRVHPETEKYFCRKLSVKEQPGLRFPCRIKAALKENERLNIGGYEIRAEQGFIRTDRSKVFDGTTGCRMACETPKIQDYRLDIFVDQNLIEIFVNEGEYVLSNVVYGLGSQIEGNVENVWIPEEEGAHEGV